MLFSLCPQCVWKLHKLESLQKRFYPKSMEFIKSVEFIPKDLCFPCADQIDGNCVKNIQVLWLL